MKHWTITKNTFKVSQFVTLQKNGDLELSPSFQRRPVWKAEAKSFLIDTIVRGLPMPIIILREKRVNLSQFSQINEVVDGQQRIRTVLSYISPHLLPDFDPARDCFTVKKIHNDEINDKRFSELPEDIRENILDYEFSVHTLPAKVDDREVLQIFARLNSTGTELRKQELRNAKFQGEFKTCVYGLASEQLDLWRNWGTFKEDEIARMEEVELTSEIIMLMLDDVRNKKPEAIDKVYSEYDESFPQKNEVSRRFRIVMEEINESLGSKMPSMFFRRKTVIYELIALYYDIIFGIRACYAL